MISEFLKVRNKSPISDLDINQSVKINKKDHTKESNESNKKNKKCCKWKFDSFLFIIIFFILSIFI